MNEIFQLPLHSSDPNAPSVLKELRAGFTTFLTLAYILFVNPDILSKAIDTGSADLFAQLLCSTALAAAAGCFIMGFLANYPFALAPGMGLNAFFAFTVVLGHGLSWKTAFAAVFCGGLIFVVLSLSGLRARLLDAIPLVLKQAMGAGIGFFLAIIGCVNGGLITADPITLVKLGNLSQPAPLLTLFGLLLTSILLAKKIRGAIVGGIIATSTIAITTGAEVFQGKAFAGFSTGFVALPRWPVDIAFQLDFSGLLTPVAISVILSFLLVDFFDTAGTLYGLASKANYLDKKGQLPRASRAFLADAFSTTLGALLGTSPTTTYIESASGIEDGGKTGLTAIFVGIMFLLAIFFWPLASAIPSVATAPVLIIVGAMMMHASAEIDWHSYHTSIPAFLTIIGMPLSFSISNGIALGMLAYAVIHLATGRGREVSPLLYLMATLLCYLLFNGG